MLGRRFLGLALLLPGCTVINPAFDVDTAGGSGDGGVGPTPPTDSASTDRSSQTASDGSTSRASASSATAPTTTLTTAPGSTEGSTTDDKDEASSSSSARGDDTAGCVPEPFVVFVEEDTFLVFASEDLETSAANFGGQATFGLLDTVTNEAVYLFRVPPIDPWGDAVSLSFTVDVPVSVNAGMLRLARVADEDLCDWSPGTQQGGPNPDGATWEVCDPEVPTDWPDGSVFGALLEQLDAIPLADLSGGPGQTDIELLLSADDFDDPEGTTPLLFTDGLADALAVAFAAESGTGPFVAFDGCR